MAVTISRRSSCRPNFATAPLSDYRETKEWGGLTADQEKEYWYRWCTEDEGEARQNFTFPRYVGQRYRFGRLPVSL